MLDHCWTLRPFEVDGHIEFRGAEARSVAAVLNIHLPKRGNLPVVRLPVAGAQEHLSRLRSAGFVLGDQDV